MKPLLTGVLDPLTLQDIVVSAIGSLSQAARGETRVCRLSWEFDTQGEMQCRYEVYDDPGPIRELVRAWLANRPAPTMETIQANLAAVVQHVWQTTGIMAPETITEALINYSGLAEQYKRTFDHHKKL